jgi:phospholipid/cholesterol/gamma-HCH transport system substrate-binding protein
MNTAQQTARVGLFFLLGVALVWVTFETLSNGKIFAPKSHTIVARFDDLRQLKAGDDVLMAGVKVGSVLKTQLAGHRGEAVLQIDSNIDIASDATATVAMSGLIGGNYVSIGMGTAGLPPLMDGAEIRTVESPDLNTITATRRPAEASCRSSTSWSPRTRRGSTPRWRTSSRSPTRSTGATAR